MTFNELKAKIEELRPGLSPESELIIALFMPFCEAQQRRIKELEDKLAKNSSNSSIPPSKDTFKPSKQRSLRQLSGKKPGGQLGHKGRKKPLSDNPDEIIPYKVSHCPDCDRDLSRIAPDDIIRRQVEDLPPIKTFITEHQIELKTCPCCAVQWQAGGCSINNEFEYGPRIKAISVYLSAFQFIPAFRTKQMLSVLGVELSTGSLDNFRRRAARELQPFVNDLTQSIKTATAGFFDETSMKIKGLGHWVHVAATSLMTLFCLHPNRGRQAHRDINILPHFKGVLHRDDYHSYHAYNEATHSLCNAHLLRDLKFAIEQNNQASWAEPLIELLLKIKEQVERADGGVLTPSWQGRHRKRYQHLVAKGLQLNPPAVKKDGSRRGRTKQSRTVNLLLRFQDQEDAILRFMTHPEACFDNNQAERDLRMNKVRQKVSGGFRSKQAGEEFMRIRSLISTAIKQGVDPIEQLVAVFSPGDESYMSLARHPE